MNIKTIKILALAFVLISMSNGAQAQDILPYDNGIDVYHPSPRYRESESHPFRIVAYALHPVGWVIREGVTRPVSYLISSNRVTKSVFGYREPFDYRQPLCFSADGA